MLFKPLLKFGAVALAVGSCSGYGARIFGDQFADIIPDNTQCNSSAGLNYINPTAYTELRGFGQSLSETNLQNARSVFVEMLPTYPSLTLRLILDEVRYMQEEEVSLGRTTASIRFENNQFIIYTEFSEVIRLTPEEFTSATTKDLFGILGRSLRGSDTFIDANFGLSIATLLTSDQVTQINTFDPFYEEVSGQLILSATTLVRPNPADAYMNEDSLPQAYIQMSVLDSFGSIQQLFMGGAFNTGGTVYEYSPLPVPEVIQQAWRDINNIQQALAARCNTSES